MEKYGQYRDKGSGIAPFFPVPSQSGSLLLFPCYLFLFCIRLPLVTFAWFVWLVILQWTPEGGILRKANLWCVLGIPGVWWIDLQVDGVRRGSLASTPRGRLPGPGQIIASSCTSPLDVLYLAAIFDPIFTQSEAGSRLVRPLRLEAALAGCFDIDPPPPFNDKNKAVELSTLVKQNRNRVIVVFPEATTSNGRSILKFCPSILSASDETKIFPVSLRYTPTDIVTPIPGWKEAASFIWRLNSRPTHCIRVRIGAPQTPANAAQFGADGMPETRAKTARLSAGTKGAKDGYESNFFDTLEPSPGAKDPVNGISDDVDENGLSERDKRILDAVAETLARLGRVKRVGLGVEEKREFIAAWRTRNKYRN